nr:putative GPI-anchored protein pfl2 [Aedes albopictus]
MSFDSSSKLGNLNEVIKQPQSSICVDLCVSDCHPQNIPLQNFPYIAQNLHSEFYSFLPTPFRTVKFRSQTSSAATATGNSSGLKRVAAEEIIEEIKQEDEPGQHGTAAVETTPAGVAGDSKASFTMTSIGGVTAAVAAVVGGGKVKKLDTTNSYSIGVRKSSLNNLVVKKKQQPTATTTTTTPAVSGASTVAGGESSKTEAVPAKTTTTVASGSSSSTNSVAAVAVATATTSSVGSTAVSGLGLLGAYSDSENSSDGNE